jgi:hypothetical protein
LWRDCGAIGEKLKTQHFMYGYVAKVYGMIGEELEIGTKKYFFTVKQYKIKRAS